MDMKTILVKEWRERGYRVTIADAATEEAHIIWEHCFETFKGGHPPRTYGAWIRGKSRWFDMKLLLEAHGFESEVIREG